MKEKIFIKMMKKKSKITSFWKPSFKFNWNNKKTKIKPINFFHQFPKKRTIAEKKLINKDPFGDYDKDGVRNIFDCKPFNRKKQSYMLRQDIKKRLMANEGISNYYKYSTPETHEKKISEKQIIRQFEKNPDLIKKAEGVKFKVLPFKSEAAGEYLGGPNTNFREAKTGGSPEVHLSTIQRKKADIRHIIKHELQHHEQDINPAYKNKIKRWERDIEKAKEKYEGSLEAIKMRKEIKKNYGEGYELKVEVPWQERGWEIDAERAANEPSARDIAKMEGPKPEGLQSFDIEEEQKTADAFVNVINEDEPDYEREDFYKDEK
jgi:hypothetical protein